MNWNRLTVSTDPASARSEYLLDLSLRVLIGLVSAILFACVMYLTWRWINPSDPHASQVPVTPVQRPTPLPEENSAAVNGAHAEVLLKPDQMYRCERKGRVTFSDYPCAEGLSRMMNLP